jgi:hypothetical protein
MMMLTRWSRYVLVCDELLKLESTTRKIETSKRRICYQIEATKEETRSGGWK